MLALIASAAATGLSSDRAHFALSPSVDKAPIPARFVGFSIEVSSTPAVFLLGGLGGTPRTSFATLMNILRAASGSVRGPNVRVGGNSADESVWLPSGDLPPNSTYRITQADLDAYRLAMPAWNGSLQIDTTILYARDPSFAVAHIAAARKTLGIMDVDEGGLVEGIEVGAFELRQLAPLCTQHSLTATHHRMLLPGNEPDLFAEKGKRPSTYGYTQYKEDYAVYMAAITASGELAGVTPRIQGAAWCSPRWNTSWLDFTRTFGANLSSLSFHTYAQTACNGNTQSSVPGLLSNNITAKFAAEVAAPLAAARAFGIPFKIGEGNSVSCGGRAGVSDVFASALWAVDTLFTAASLGLVRFNFHGMPEGPYSAIAYEDKSSNVPNVRPLFYGLLAFATASGSTGDSAHMLRVTTVTTTNDYLRCWSVWDAAANATRIVVLNKDPHAAVGDSATVTLSTQGSGALLSPQGKLVRLLSGAKGMLAQWSDDISWQGQTFSASEDGTPSGSPTSEAVAASAEGDFVFSVPTASLAMLTLSMAF